VTYTLEDFEANKPQPIGLDEAAWDYQTEALNEDPTSCRLEGTEAIVALLQSGPYVVER
jgi:hypothetical protein